VRGVRSVRSGEGERLVVELLACRSFEGLQCRRKGGRGRRHTHRDSSRGGVVRGDRN